MVADFDVSVKITYMKLEYLIVFIVALMVLYKDFECSVSSAHFQEREHKFNPDFVVSGLKSLQEVVHMSFHLGTWVCYMCPPFQYG